MAAVKSPIVISRRREAHRHLGAQVTWGPSAGATRRRRSRNARRQQQQLLLVVAVAVAVALLLLLLLLLAAEKPRLSRRLVGSSWR
jgi:hypothetical protein